MGMQNDAKPFKFSRAVKSALNRASHRMALAQYHRVVADSRDWLIEQLVEHIVSSAQFTDDELLELLEQAAAEAEQRIAAGGGASEVARRSRQ